MDRQRKHDPCSHVEATLGLELRVVGRLTDSKDRCGQTPRPSLLFTKPTFLTLLCEQSETLSLQGSVALRFWSWIQFLFTKRCEQSKSTVGAILLY